MYLRNLSFTTIPCVSIGSDLPCAFSAITRNIYSLPSVNFPTFTTVFNVLDFTVVQAFLEISTKSQRLVAEC